MSARPTVVKLGGSHAASSMLRPWLQAIGRAAGPVVLVPGGGPFADAVRAAQLPMRFDDAAAHAMALLAMAQFGRALASLAAGFVMADSLPGLQAALAAGLVPVWSPLPMLQDAPDVPQSWDVTSDSLALWLAHRLAAPQVLLVKHRATCPGAAVADWVAEGLVDRAFPNFLARFAGRVFLAGPDDVPAAGLDPAHLPGVMLEPAHA